MRSRITRILVAIAVTIAVLVISVIGPVNRDVVEEGQLYAKMKGRLETAHPVVSEGSLEVGWSQVNITPGYPMPMAGYRLRQAFESVHDSLYARVISVRNGGPTISLVSVDLLIFPPMLRDRLRQKMDSASMGNLLYLSSTHTHNGVGGWDYSVVGEASMGELNLAWIESTANGLLRALADAEYLPAQINYWESDANELVENRLDPENGATDGAIRGIEFVRSDSSNAALYTFSAHSTCVNPHSLALSGDYPAATTALMLKKFDFAMFMAGMVGSHRFANLQQDDFEFVDKIAAVLEQKTNMRKRDSGQAAATLSFTSVPIEFGPSQVRVAGNWKLNDWLFSRVIRPLDGDITVLGIGNIIMLGLPCDFSGEIYNIEGLGTLAEAQGRHLIITSFNGDYIGYINHDRHYDESKAEEMRTLNWVGPGYGQYFTDIIESIVTGAPLHSNE